MTKIVEIIESEDESKNFRTYEQVKIKRKIRDKKGNQTSFGKKCQK